MELTVKELAAKERVHVRTVRRWVQIGAVDYRRTPGGQIRIIDGGQNKRVVVISANTSS
jgi:excisionase family DNA binding protein